VGTAPRVVTLPKKVEVGSYEFALHVVPASDTKLDGADGICYFAEEDGGRAIFVAAGLGLRKMLDVVLHELTHAINWCHDIDDGADEEAIATKHGTAWSQLFLDNPKFQRWLVSILNRIRKERLDA
jgi:hypothetical protein